MTTMQKNVAASLAAFALALFGLLAGCRSHHLGPDHGRAYHEAWSAQAQSETEGLEMSSADAKQVMKVRTKGPASEDDSGAAGLPLAPLPMGGGMSGGADSGMSGGAWPGASGNITLEAK